MPFWANDAAEETLSVLCAFAVKTVCRRGLVMRSQVKLSRVFIPFMLGFILLAASNSATAGQASSPPADSILPWVDSPAETSKPPGGPIEPELLRALLDAEPDESLRVIVYLREQANLGEVVGTAPSATEARSRVVSALQATAARSQAPLQAYLEGARVTGDVEHYRPFWIVNAIAVRARPAVIRALAARPDVASVRLDHYRQWIADSRLHIADSNLESPISNLEWNVARIRADAVWASLHISGTGTVVAGMDSGVDWNHPALEANYRGYNPHGPPNHAYSWYDATGTGYLYPVDDHAQGHGTHTMGTAVGLGGIGVAPGAQWIAVKAFSREGYAYESWIHDGFQWLLAPGGDPNRAPDVVNCSWGSDDGYLTTFQPDLQALRAAGIFAVFANGNSGPWEGTVGSPASLPEAFAVGATDAGDEVADFSSRGPSPWDEIRPHVAAPGVGVRSSQPGGVYGSLNGTSMAAPHVSGIVALLRSVSPTLSITRTAFLITSTAVPLGDPLPNNDTGWGRVDAFAAVATLAQHGLITGTVTQAGDGTPIAGARVSATAHGGGGGGTAIADGDGNYLLALAPAAYDLTASAFGYEPTTVSGVEVVADATTVANLSLVPLPSGTLRGRVTDADTGQPVAAAVSVLDAPLETTASTYTFTLPEGSYTVRARSLGYRVVTATVHITAGQVTTADFALTPAPTILLVDGGGWYYRSQAGYFRQALDDLSYAYDEWSIRHILDDVPEAADLVPYDVVVWTDPEDAPGDVGANDALTGYLTGGGRLFLSGQDIGFLDDYWGHFSYYRGLLKVRYVQDNAGVWTLEGTPGEIFAGLTITIAGPGGADNQGYPDEITVLDPDAAASVLTYQGGDSGDALSFPKGGVCVGTCLDYRAIYLSFGFEAINDRVARREVMERSLGWLTAALPTAGLELTPDTQTHVAPPGVTVTHTVRVRHVGQAGTTDVVSLTLEGVDWTAQLGAPSLTLAPCVSATVVVTVTVPLTAGWDARDVVTLTARSSLSPTLSQSAVFVTKAPALVLLVDDDIFFEQMGKYQAALDGAGVPYDFWQTCPAVGWCWENSPPLDVLQWYPIIVWWTGYDWSRPVTSDQEAALAIYLASGGRLFLSSQDFLYYHHKQPFSRDYLGVLAYTEDSIPTLARGVPRDPIGGDLGPYLLNYPFQNMSDGMQPTPGTAVSFRDQEQRGIAVARREGGHAAVFFSFPFETLPQGVRPLVMGQTVGWLSWLGGSTFAANRETVSGGDTLTYTIALRNDGPVSITASLSNTLPASLTMIPGSLTGPSAALEAGLAVYSPTGQISWEGPLGPGSSVTVTYRVTVATGLPALTPITNTVLLGLEDQAIHFRRTAVVRVGAPDLSSSALRCDPAAALPAAVVTCTLALANGGLADAPTAVVTNVLPSAAAFVSGSLTLEGGGAAELLTGTVRWAGPLSIGNRVTVTYRLTLPTDPFHPPMYGVAFLEDGLGGAWERPTWLFVEPLRYYLPAVLRRG
jgi:uncharacterized repeat protein (TIGR01451 family)